MSFRFARLLAPALFAAALGLLSAAPASATTVYQNDFEGGIGTEWTSSLIDHTPSGNRGYLGRFGGETVFLHLTNLPTHQWLTLSFDLYVIGDWRGNASGGFRDVWSCGVENSNAQVTTTFSTGAAAQAFPARGLGVSYPAGTGAAEQDTLGYGADAVYHVVLTFLHNQTSATLKFTGNGPTAIDQKSWGLDNVRVEARTSPLGQARVTPRHVRVGANPVTVTITNRGHGTLSGFVSPLSGPVLVSDGDGSFTVAAGATHTVTLVRASGAHARSGKVKTPPLVIATDDPANQRILVPVK